MNLSRSLILVMLTVTILVLLELTPSLFCRQAHTRLFIHLEG